MSLVPFMTLKASPFSNRGVRLGVPPADESSECTLKECPNAWHIQLLGHPYRVRLSRIHFRGYSLCSHPRLQSGDAFSVYSTRRSTAISFPNFKRTSPLIIISGPIFLHEIFLPETYNIITIKKTSIYCCPVNIDNSLFDG